MTLILYISTDQTWKWVMGQWDTVAVTH